MVMRAPKLRTLCLSNCGIGKCLGLRVAEHLTMHAKDLTELTIRHNPMGAEAANSMVMAASNMNG